MNKSTLLLGMLTVFGHSLMGQIDGSSADMRERVTFGLKGGMNYSNVYRSKGQEFGADPKWGVAAGWFATVPLGRYFGIQPELLLSQRGLKGRGRMLGSTYDFARTSTYLDIPMMAAFKPSAFLTILLGPQYSYLIRQKDVFTSTAYSFEQESEFKKDHARKNTMCVATGFDVNVDHVVLALRAGWDLQSNTGDGSAITPRYNSLWYQCTLGYRF